MMLVISLYKKDTVPLIFPLTFSSMLAHQPLSFLPHPLAVACERVRVN